MAKARRSGTIRAVSPIRSAVGNRVASGHSTGANRTAERGSLPVPVVFYRDPMAHDDDHDHDDGHHRKGGLLGRLRRLGSHDHDHGSQLIETNAAGIRASKVSLVGLGVTAAFQAVLVVITGSVRCSPTRCTTQPTLSPRFRCGSPSRWVAVTKLEAVHIRTQQGGGPGGTDHRRRHRGFRSGGGVGVD